MLNRVKGMIGFIGNSTNYPRFKLNHQISSPLSQTTIFTIPRQPIPGSSSSSSSASNPSSSTLRHQPPNLHPHSHSHSHSYHHHHPGSSVVRHQHPHQLISSVTAPITNQVKRQGVVGGVGGNLGVIGGGRMYLLVSSYESRTDGPTYVTTRDANIIQKLKALRIIEEPLKFTNYNCYNYKFEYPDICVLDWFQLLGYRVQTMAMTYDPGVACIKHIWTMYV